jgi:hypothetical protein
MYDPADCGLRKAPIHNSPRVKINNRITPGSVPLKILRNI